MAISTLLEFAELVFIYFFLSLFSSYIYDVHHSLTHLPAFLKQLYFVTMVHSVANESYLCPHLILAKINSSEWHHNIREHLCTNIYNFIDISTDYKNFKYSHNCWVQQKNSNLSFSEKMQKFWRWKKDTSMISSVSYFLE